MNRVSFFLLSIVGVFLLLSVFFSSPTDVYPVSQVTITPTAFSYLPFVAKNWPPTATPTSTPTKAPVKPVPGNWRGENVSFTVTFDSSTVTQFKLQYDTPVCGNGLYYFFVGFPIDASGRFMIEGYDSSLRLDVRIIGEFVSATTATGTWSIWTYTSASYVTDSNSIWDDSPSVSAATPTATPTPTCTGTWAAVPVP